jgi:hypothetical protein
MEVNMRTSWRSVHAEIDGALIDRDRAYNNLILEMRPLGTELPKSEQVRELHLNIEDGVETVLDEEGLAALEAFLKEKP